MEYQNIITAIWGLLVIIFTSFSGIAINQGVRFIKSKHAEHLAIQVVLFVQDMFGSLGGQEKLEKAIHFLGEKLRKIPGFKKITDAEIESLIRAAYQKVFGLVKQDMAGTTTTITNNISAPKNVASDEIAKKLMSADSLVVAKNVIESAGNPNGSAKINPIDAEAVTPSGEIPKSTVLNGENIKTPEETKEGVKTEPIKSDALEVEKPLSEMTLTDLKNVMTQVVKDQLQAQTATTFSSSAQMVSAQ